MQLWHGEFIAGWAIFFLGKGEAWRIISQEGWGVWPEHTGRVLSEERAGGIYLRNAHQHLAKPAVSSPLPVWFHSRTERIAGKHQKKIRDQTQGGSDDWESQWRHQKLRKQSHNSPEELRAVYTHTAVCGPFSLRWISATGPCPAQEQQHWPLQCPSTSHPKPTRFSVQNPRQMFIQTPPQMFSHCNIFTPQQVAQSPRDLGFSWSPALPPCPGEETQSKLSWDLPATPQVREMHFPPQIFVDFMFGARKFLPLREWGLNSKFWIEQSLKISSFCTDFFPYE